MTLTDGGTTVTKKTGASMNRGGSKQDVQTPREVLDAVERRFGRLTFDLAASPENAVCEKFYTEKDDSLSPKTPWPTGRLWLNPPYSNIRPWTERCAREGNPEKTIFLLVPGSIGANWYWDCVEPHAVVYALRPRIKFVGYTGSFPKDLVLAVYGLGVTGFSGWRWK